MVPRNIIAVLLHACGLNTTTAGEITAVKQFYYVFFMVDVRFELTTNDPCSTVVAIYRVFVKVLLIVSSPLGKREKVNQSPIAYPI